MTNLKQIISLILFLVFGMSAVFNILFLFNKAEVELTQTGFLILVLVVFLVSLLGFILKKIRKEEVFPVSIITPAKEMGILYSGMLTIWTVTYFLTMISK